MLGTGGVVVVGRPGIGMHPFADCGLLCSQSPPNLGKTCFLYYLLLRLLNQKQPVAFQVKERFFLFQSSGVLLCDSSSGEEHTPPGTWALSDSHVGYEVPCGAFLAASQMGDAWLVQSSSPSTVNWERWQKEQSAILHWMKVFSFAEIKALG